MQNHVKHTISRQNYTERAGALPLFLPQPKKLTNSLQANSSAVGAGGVRTVSAPASSRTSPKNIAHSNLPMGNSLPKTRRGHLFRRLN